MLDFLDRIGAEVSRAGEDVRKRAANGEGAGNTERDDQQRAEARRLLEITNAQ
jgi:hypothetical protein